MKKVLFAASECVPFVKTGGLADVVGALPKEFDRSEWDIRVVLPDYTCIPPQYRDSFQYVCHFQMGMGSYIGERYVGVMQYEYQGITYYFILMGIRATISRNLFSLTRQYFPCYRSLTFSRISFTAMIGRQD